MASTSPNAEGMNSNLGIDPDQVTVKVNYVSFQGLGRTSENLAKFLVKKVFEARTPFQLHLGLRNARNKLLDLDIFENVKAEVNLNDSNTSNSSSGVKGLNVKFIGNETYYAMISHIRPEMGAFAHPQLSTGLKIPNIFGYLFKVEADYVVSRGRESSVGLVGSLPLIFFDETSISYSLRKSKTLEEDSSPKCYLNSWNRTWTYLSRLWKGNGTEVKYKLEVEKSERFLTELGQEIPFPFNDSGRTQNPFQTISNKGVIRQVLTVDTRDKKFIALRGTFAKLLLEYAGLTGDVNYVKMEAELQHNFNVENEVTFQTSLRAGIMKSHGNKSFGVIDKFFLGGPFSLRGFAPKGVHANDFGTGLGGQFYWSLATHMYLPFAFDDVVYFGLHFFANAGHVAQRFYGKRSFSLFERICSACGCGISLAISEFAMLELNYVFPLMYGNEDVPVHGFQWGLGLNFL